MYFMIGARMGQVGVGGAEERGQGRVGALAAWLVTPATQGAEVRETGSSRPTWVSVRVYLKVKI